MMPRRSVRTLLIFVVAVLGVSLIHFGCQSLDPISADGLSGGETYTLTNKPPETYLSLSVAQGESLAVSTSTKEVNWWGEDSDGWVVSYLYRWGLLDTDTLDQVIDTLWYGEDWDFVNDSSWIQTEFEDMECVLPILTARASFILQVRAVDNAGASDPEPAEIVFPVTNSKPNVEFRISSNPTTFAGRIYTTFNIRTFVWDGTDPDGNSTIKSASYAIDPVEGDTNWVILAGTENSVTLRDIESGDHTFYLKVTDLAGSDSPTIMFPNPASEDDPSTWRVKQPAGHYLIVDDYRIGDHLEHESFYKAVFDSIYGEEGVGYSYWDLDGTIPYVSSDLSETLLKFDRILWYSYFGQPLLLQAFNSMYSFINSSDDRRMLLTTMSVDTGMVLDLADSTYPVGLIAPTDQYGDPVYFVPAENSVFPTLHLGLNVGRTVIGLDTSSTAEVVYKLDESTVGLYSGTPVICARREDKSYTLLTVPLQAINDRPSVGQFIKAVFDDE